MHERFTDRARKVLKLAEREAAGLGFPFVATEHLLLGLLAEGSGVGFHTLLNLDADTAKIREEVIRLIGPGPGPALVMMGRPGCQTPRAKRVIEYAVEEAADPCPARLGHENVGSEHILLGLLRESEGVAAQVLSRLGVTLQGVREELVRLEASGVPPEEAAAARTAAAPTTCKWCGTRAAAGARHCHYCGAGFIAAAAVAAEELAPDEPFCRRCGGNFLPAPARYCHHCGEPIPEPSKAVNPLRPEEPARRLPAETKTWMFVIAWAAAAVLYVCWVNGVTFADFNEAVRPYGLVFGIASFVGCIAWLHRQ